MTRFRHRFLIPVATAALTAGLLGTAQAGAPAAAPRAAAADATLATDLDALLQDPRLAGAMSGVLVQDASTGETLYEHQADSLLLPASTLKTFTSTAAVHTLGVDYRFTTDVLTSGERHGDVVLGDLVLRGGGDFSLQPADLEALAQQVADSGVHTVVGSLVADDTRYDANRLGSGWSWDDLPYYYAPQISALTLSPNGDDLLGTARLTVTPAGTAGEPAAVQVTPADAPVHLDGEISTAAAGAGTGVSVQRKEGGNEITLSGSVAVGSAPDQETTTVDDPTGYTAAVFNAALQRHGVTVLQPVAEHATPAGAQVLATHSSGTLGELLSPLLKESNNGIAEHLVKELGFHAKGTGSWAAGLQVVSGYLNGLGIAPTALRQRDGSGLTRYDVVTPRQIATVLRSVQSEPWFQTWYDALPVAGRPEPVGGTLAGRMQGTAAAGNVHAKTGSMTGVHALVGYVTTPDGRRLVFAVDFNNYVGASPRSIEDAIAVRLATGPAAAKAAAPRRAAPQQAVPQQAAPESGGARRYGPGFDPEACGVLHTC